MDSHAGAALGRQIGDLVCRLAGRGEGAFKARAFDVTAAEMKMDGSSDFLLSAFDPDLLIGAPVTIAPDDVVTHVFDAAMREWPDMAGTDAVGHGAGGQPLSGGI